MHRLQQAGDTIVEVMISLGILTLILAGAYYTANLSLKNDQDAQEHTVALTIAQDQVELLRVYPKVFWVQGAACLNNSLQLTGTTDCYVLSSNTSNIQATKPATPQPFYYTVNIALKSEQYLTISGVTATLNTYKVVVQWPALGGDAETCTSINTTTPGCDYVTLYYKADV